MEKKEIIKELNEIAAYALASSGCSCEDVLKDGLKEVSADIKKLIKKIK